MPEAKTKTQPKTKATTVKKDVAQPIMKKVEAKTKKTATVKEASLSVDVMGIDGKAKGKITLPKEIFGVKVSEDLMAQAVRVYLANQRQGTQSTKTRSEVVGSTRKIYRQKGTGRARHGALKAPIFVGGGIAFGPKPRDFSLEFPKKMKKAALYSSLSLQLKDNKVMVIDGVAGVSGKTKEMIGVLHALNLTTQRKKAHKVLFVIGEKVESMNRSLRNIEGLTIRYVQDLNTYEVLNSHHLVFVKNTIEMLTKKG